MDDDDPFLWLEDIEGKRALAWVKAENARSLGVLEADPNYRAFLSDALKIVSARDRIPRPFFLGTSIGNFWQDDDHVRGVLRHTSLLSYRSAEPAWEILLDLDALAKAEARNWVFHGLTLLPPEDQRALIALSDGGKDAVTFREFDLVSRRFVENGFMLPEGKQSAAWLDIDTLLVARDWGSGTLTASGYGYIVKRWRRGCPLDAAEEIFRGTALDVSAHVDVLRDPDGPIRGLLASRALSFFECEYSLLTAEKPIRLPLPLKARFQEYFSGQLIFTLQEEWHRSADEHIPMGALLSIELDAAILDPANAPLRLIYVPGPRTAIEDITVTRSRLLVTITRNVIGTILSYRFEKDQWMHNRLALPEKSSLEPVAANDRDDNAFIRVTSFLQPETLWLSELSKRKREEVKTSPARFDASSIMVEQLNAKSKDGTKIPYFVIRSRKIVNDGTAPTLLTGYGGFQVSLTPAYAPLIGKLWIERGGTYVVANIRGGGEFGPAWHQAALKNQRQRAYDDFIAVIENLITRNMTSQRRLGIMGGSNGGLLMGVMLTKRPDLFRAAVIDVPLLDMLRYHKLLAGASWIGEYGDPDEPESAAFWRRFSPYHNLSDGIAYPEPLFVTSTKDDRVHPGHARKFAAKMQSLGLPFLFYENIEGGHSAAANLQERARRTALEFTYLTQKLMD